MIDIQVIACCDSNRAIGKDNKLLYTIGEDLKRFKEMTTKQIVIMGYNTYKSLPEKVRPLPNRFNIILTRQSILYNNTPQNTHMFCTFTDCFEYLLTNHNNRQIYVIGGGEIYIQFINFYFTNYFNQFQISQIHLTQVLKKPNILANEVNKYTYFPRLDHLYYVLVNNSEVKVDSKTGDRYCYLTYESKSYNKSQKLAHNERQYLNQLSNIMKNGKKRINRTGIDTYSVFGGQLEFDISNSIPIITTKFVPVKGCIEELLWFLRGDTNAKHLQEKGVKIWDGNSSREFLDKCGLTHLEEGDCGKNYSHQWRRFGADYIDCNTPLPKNSYHGVDQINEALRMLKEDPYSRRIIVSAWNPCDLKKTVLPSCFTEDALVLTNNGYKFIKDVDEKNDLLYTHLGHYKRIEQKYITTIETSLINIKIDYHGQSIKCTPNHPFYVKSYKESKPNWINASELTNEHYIGMKINTNSIIPKFDLQENIGEFTKNKEARIKTEILEINEHDQWYMLGYFIGNGWITHKNDCNKYRIHFVVANHQIDYFKERITQYLTLYEIKNKDKNCIEFEGRQMNWWTVFKEFGYLANDKIIPEWVHDAPVEFIKSFLEGYQFANGCHDIKNREIKYTTVSDDIAFSIQRLYLKINKFAALSYQIRPPTTLIESRNTYSINFKYNDTVSNDNNNNNMNDNKSSYFEDDIVWYKIKDINIIPSKEQTVYNFNVKDDHTYIVNNLITHNCHSMFQFMVEDDDKGNKLLNCHMYQRSCDMFLGEPWNIFSYALLTYIFAKKTGMKPYKLFISFGDCHIYENHIEQCREQLKRNPLAEPKIILDDSIITKNWSEITVNDFQVIGYFSHPVIKADMAV